jgi:hypothetical protein
MSPVSIRVTSSLETQDTKWKQLDNKAKALPSTIVIPRQANCCGVLGSKQSTGTWQ